MAGTPWLSERNCHECVNSCGVALGYSYTRAATRIQCRSVLAHESHRRVATLAQTSRPGCGLRLALRGEGSAQFATLEAYRDTSLLAIRAWRARSRTFVPMPYPDYTAPRLAAASSADGRKAPLQVQRVLDATEAELAQLDGLLRQQCQDLIAAFEAAMQALEQAGDPLAHNPADAAVEQARKLLGEAVVSLQYQDIASQILSHCRARLQGCAMCVASDQVLAGHAQGHAADCVAADGGVAPFMPPLHKGGSVELFDDALLTGQGAHP